MPSLCSLFTGLSGLPSLTQEFLLSLCLSWNLNSNYLDRFSVWSREKEVKMKPICGNSFSLISLKLKLFHDPEPRKHIGFSRTLCRIPSFVQLPNLWRLNTAIQWKFSYTASTVPVDQAICSYCHLIPGFSVTILIRRVAIEFLIFSSKDAKIFLFPSNSKAGLSLSLVVTGLSLLFFSSPPCSPCHPPFPQGFL